MLLNVYSYNGTLINDGTNYTAWFEVGQPAGVNARPSYASRTRAYPLLSGKEINGTSIILHIETRGTIHSQLETLDALFAVLRNTWDTLICTDAADSNRQWYLKCTPIEPLQVSAEGIGEYVVTLAVDEPLWRTVTAVTASEQVTASGESLSLSVLGNWYARPVITLTINGLKGIGYQKTQWKPWYNPLSRANNEFFDVTGGGINTSTLVADTSISNQINNGGGIAADTLSIPIDTSVGGGLSTSGGMCYVDSEQIYYTSIAAGVMTVYDDGEGTTGRGWGGTTAAVHADNAVMKKSIVLANGNDIRVFDGENEIPRFLGGMNTSATKIWVRPGFAPALTMRLLAGIGSGAITSISLAKTAANLAALKRLPKQFMFLIDNEVFFGSNPVPSGYKFTVTARAQKGTSAATHAKTAVVRWLDVDLTIAYGDAEAEAPEQDDSIQPLFNLASSTNTSLVYSAYQSDDGLRAGAWSDAVTRRTSPALENNSRIYTATQNDLADPASVLGFAVKTFQLSGVWKAENFTGSIGISHPAGFTTVSCSGNKRRDGSAWISIKFQKSHDGINWVDVWTEATPASAGIWGALSSHSSVSLGGTYMYVRWFTNGTLSAIPSAANYVEQTSDTMVLDSSNVPQLAFATSVNSSYALDATIAVTETSESLRVRGACKTGDVVVIDCDRETAKLNGKLGGVLVMWNTERDDWLDLPSAKQSETCTLTYTETGVTDVTMGVSFEHRSIL